MPWTLNLRFWGLLALLVLLPILYMKGRVDGRKLEKAAVAASVEQANREARRLEQRRADRAHEAAVLAAERQRVILADAARARAAADGLRDTLDVVERASAQSADAARKSVAALRDVLGQCTAAYRELAEVADRHAADSLMLQRAWPK